MTQKAMFGMSTRMYRVDTPMKRAVATAAIACIAMTACGPFHRIVTAAPAVATSARIASHARTAPPAPSPKATPTGPIVYSTAPCRLPMGAITEASGVFVLYPGGALADAPGSEVALPGQEPGQIGANPGVTYDAVMRKWVPVPYFWLTPDGTTYVFEDYAAGKIFAVDVANGTAKQLAVPPGRVLSGTSDIGVFVQAPAPGGAWFYPFDGAEAHVVAQGNYWLNYNSDSIWRFSSASGGSLERHNVLTGADVVLATLGGWNDIVGFDRQGDPLILNSADVPSSSPRQGYRLILIGADGHATALWSGTGSRAVGLAVGDDHGVWFVIADSDGIPSHQALYLWTPRSGATRITNLDGNVANDIAGTCT